MKEIGLYIHVPFCDGKCPYCDFYSLRGDEETKDRYTAALCSAMEPYAGQAVKTVYFGGGTPNLLGPRRLSDLLAQIGRRFSIAGGAEVTLEANPTHVSGEFFRACRRAGFNRLSMGLQSANEDELRLLGRKHSKKDVENAVNAARAAGFENISLDLMLGLPGGSKEALGRSVSFAAGLGAEHISSYILKVEEGTPFAAKGIELPDGDATADQYLFLVEELRKRGYDQYEISNFSRPGKESRHNLVYWHGEEYLGFGPGAHSFYEGKRFYFARSLKNFLAGEPPVPDGEGGSPEEYVMLNLRLTEGLRLTNCRERFGEEGEKLFSTALKNAKKCPPGLVRADAQKICFTPEGFLVSNALLVKLLS